MAGLASAFHFSKTTPSLSSIESKFFGLHLCNLNHFFLISFSPSSHHHNVSITARYGGGGGPRFAGSDYSRRRQKEKDLEEEQAFDIDGIRYLKTQTSYSSYGFTENKALIFVKRVV